MHARSWRRWCAVAAAASVFCFTVGLSADAPKQANTGVTDTDDGTAVPVAEARARAKLMHSIYAATLDVMHHHFFRRDRSILPARAMEDVFAEMESQSDIKAQWISVNAKAMSIQHEPKSDFEKQAARAIAAGKQEFEVVESRYYRRAGAIPLGGGCVSCHTGFFSKTPQAHRFAGLVISIPIKKK